FTKGADQTVLEDAGPQTVVNWATGISAGNNDPAQVLTFHTLNSNSSLFSVPPGISPSGTLTYTPAANAIGPVTISGYLTDDAGGLSATQTFAITVTSVNDAPSFVKGADQTILEDNGPQTVTGWATSISAGPADESSQSVSFLVSSDNSALFSAGPAIS